MLSYVFFFSNVNVNIEICGDCLSFGASFKWALEELEALASFFRSNVAS